MLGETAIDIEEDKTLTANDLKRIENAAATVDDLLGRHEWEAAAAAVANIRRLFPNSTLAIEMAKQVTREKEPHRRRLRRRFLDAAKGDNPEQAMDLLKELDKYLSRSEAAPIMKVAQGVIERAKLHRGERFKAAIRDADWNSATKIGGQIMRDFENTRMASEVSEMIDLLRERAAEQGPAF